jgi:Electron transfer DM13
MHLEKTMAIRRSVVISSAVVVGAVLWYLFRPDALVLSKTVNEPFPAAEESPSAMGESSMGMAHSSMASSSAMGNSGEAEPVRLVSGRFHTNAHETKGVATIYVLDDGRRVLRFTEFSTSNGPDVRVYLVAAADVQEEDAAKQAGFVDLGAMKGNIGDQNYDIPAGLDLTKYRAVSVWCRRFSVNFGAAPLAQAM